MAPRGTSWSAWSSTPRRGPRRSTTSSPVGGRGSRSRRTFESLGNRLSAFTSMQDFVLEDGDLGRPPLVWGEEGMPPWLDVLRPILSLG
ncbi:MAG: hypothetical protein RXR82_08815 [Nitrososphaeria archaeon]